MKLTVDEIAQRMLQKTSTGFEPHPDKSKYHGFTCPNCGRHEFGTSSVSAGITIGHCHGYLHSDSTCSFTWNRNDTEDEGNVMHTMTAEEWKLSFKA